MLQCGILAIILYAVGTGLTEYQAVRASVYLGLWEQGAPVFAGLPGCGSVTSTEGRRRERQIALVPESISKYPISTPNWPTKP